MAIPKEQKALVNLILPGPLSLISRPVPTPEEEDVLVKIESIALNPTEYKVRRSGTSVVTEYPVVMGMDGAGIVVKKDDEVEGFEVGDRVCVRSFGQ